MNVVEEKIDDLNALLRVSVETEDYATKVADTLKRYKKEANMPGFRPGKAPMSYIKKRYGKGVLAEELNNLVNQSLNDFIVKNNLNILGQPLPKEDEEVKGDFENPAEFEFVYEVGLTPEFEVKLSKKNKFDYLKIAVSDEMLNKEVDNLARRYGQLVSADEAGEKDMVIGEFAEKEGNKAKEGGITNTSTISLEFVEDEDAKSKFVGKKVGDSLTLDPKTVSKDTKDMAAMLGISEEQAADLDSKFTFKITEVKQMVPAAVDQELFDKLFGPGVVSSEDELKERIKADLENMFKNDSDRLFSQKITDYLVEKADFELPEAFLKRWIVAADKNNLTMAEVEADFENYKKSLKWQLIQNKLLTDNELSVKPEEAVEYTKGLLVNQYAQYGMPAPEDKELEVQAKNVLSNQEEANKIYDNIYGSKLLQHFKEVVKVDEKELDYDAFLKEAYAN